MRKFLILITILISFSYINAQRTLTNSITGKVLDKSAKVPLEYSNIILFRVSDSTQVNGTITNKEGVFNISPIRPDNYYLKISFIGYEFTTINDINITPKTNLDLGEILLSPEIFDTDDIVVSGERAAVSYEIDKKVINVSEQLTSLSGTAVDVLENVPSVTVDIEGNVSLRGSSNFTVLVDGKPSILEGSEALQNIPASLIENIEIITNPSAKYNPEGTAGIINVLTKESDLTGMSGIVNLNGGNGERYGGDGIFDLKNSLINFNLGVDYNNRRMEMESETNNWILFNQQKNFNSSLGSSNRGGKSYGIKSAVTFNFSKNDALTLNGRYGYREGLSNSNLAYSKWTDVSSFIDKFSTMNDRSRSGGYFGGGLNYFHNFSDKDHVVSLDFIYQHRNSDEYTLFKQFDITNVIVEGQEQTEAGPSNSFDLKLDYTYPITADSKFEAGYKGEFNSADDVSQYFIYDTNTTEFELQELFSKNIEYNNNIHALYSMYSNQIDNLGIQFGVRAESTDRVIELQRTAESFSINQWDYFPSLHFSFKLDQSNQFMTSYTRRIDRPRGWELEPFVTWMDPYNVRKGNPALEPEYIDSYELGYQRLFNKSIFSAELYYRVNNNKVERVESVYGENITLHSVDNVGKDYTFGSELMLNFDPVTFWNVNLMGNLYNYKIVGELNGLSFDRGSFNWDTRFNNSFNLSTAAQIQVNLFYNSPTVSAQGTREGYVMTNIALRYLFFNKQFALTLQARDVFGTAKREFTSESIDFYRYSNFTP